MRSRSEERFLGRDWLAAPPVLAAAFEWLAALPELVAVLELVAAVDLLVSELRSDDCPWESAGAAARLPRRGT